MSRTEKFVVTLTVGEDANTLDLADRLLDLLCDQSEAPYDSCDSVDPQDHGLVTEMDRRLSG